MAERNSILNGLGRVLWFMLLPLFVANGVVWLLGKVLEAVGDALQQGADAIRDELVKWGRVLFSVTPAPAKAPR